MKFSLVPLLITGQSISPEVRQALRENRLQDAAKLIMQEYGLSCGADGQSRAAADNQKMRDRLRNSVLP